MTIAPTIPMHPFFSYHGLFRSMAAARPSGRGAEAFRCTAGRGKTSLEEWLAASSQEAPQERILHVIPSLDPTKGGPSRAVIEISAMNGADGLQPTVAFGAPADEVAGLERTWSERYPEIRFRGFPYSFPRRFEASRALVQWLAGHSHEFDVLHVHSVYSLLCLHACSVAEAAQLPYILRPLGSLDPYDLRKKHFLKYHIFAPWVRRILAKARFVHCTAQQEDANLETFGARASRKVLPLPVSAPAFAGDGARFRSALGVSDDACVFLFLSRLDEKKGLDLLLPAMREAAASHPEAQLVIAGSGAPAFAEKVNEWAAETGLGGRVHFTGFLQGQAKADAFAGSDCFVLPSRFENFGIAVVEALSHGLPVLISDQVYIWQEIVEANAGWVCQCSRASLAAAMQRILDDRTLLAGAGRRARTLARHFEPENLTSAYHAAYEEAALFEPAHAYV